MYDMSYRKDPHSTLISVRKPERMEFVIEIRLRFVQCGGGEMNGDDWYNTDNILIAVIRRYIFFSPYRKSFPIFSSFQHDKNHHVNIE